MNNLLTELHATEFKTNGEILMAAPFGNGHIHKTYLLADVMGGQYIFQRINKNVFKDPEVLMNNIIAVTDHQRKKTDSRRQSITLIETHDGKYWHVDDKGEYWRMYRFISDSICLEHAETLNDLRESGVAFGYFQRQLSDFPAQTLTETIPKFHDTPDRYAALVNAMKVNTCGRVKDTHREIAFALERESYTSKISSLQASGDLPVRVTHNDTKLNNILFDRDTRRALCVIDLDTVMPGAFITCSP